MHHAPHAIADLASPLPAAIEPPRSIPRGAGRYVALLLGAVLLLTGSVLAASIALDPYRVLLPNRPAQINFEPNTRATKIAQLAANGCAQFDGFVLGASRANFYPTAAVEAAFGGRFYNMAVSGETLFGMLARTRWLLRHCAPRQLLVTIDPQQFGWGRDHGDDLLRGEPPETGGPSRLRFLARYAFLPPQAIWLSAREHIAPRPAWYQSNLADGTHTGTDAADPAAAHTRRVGHLPQACHAPERMRPDLVAANLDALARLVAEARAGGVHLTVLVHPLNQNQLALLDFEQVADWAAKVARISGRVLFFGGFHALSEDDAGYFDLGHFDLGIGAAVMREAAAMTQAPPADGLVGLYDAASAPLLQQRLSANLAARAARCAAR